MVKEKEWYFSYNCEGSIQWGGGAKRGHVIAKNKTEARTKIKEFLQKMKGTLCIELF